MSENEGKDSVCYLRVKTADSEPELFRIRSFPCRIGRTADSDVRISEASISTLHAVILQLPDGRLQIEDQWSTNGMYLNRRRVTQLLIDQPLELTFGRVRVDVALSEEELSGDVQKSPAKETVIGAPTDTAPPSPAEGRKALPTVSEIADAAAAARRAAKDRKEHGPKRRTPVSASGQTVSRRGIVCPHCWHRFDVEEFLFIARHQNLVGDPVLGADAQQRFLPSRFTPEGNALDSAGMSCPDMACPRCHLRIPQAASENPPLFLSIVGATASGKSYFLTSMTWELRNSLSKNFAISFTDTDAVNNQLLNDFEETIFLNSRTDSLVALRKTELQGELYNQVLLDSMLINLPKPFMFTVTPSEHHPDYETVREKMSRTLVLYDNAGEHFEPGMDSVDNPTTQHLLHSDTIFFLFDPTKDVRFRQRLADSSDPQLEEGTRVQRQEIILTEMINRIKKYSGMRSGVKTAKSLVIIVAKFDIWRELLDMSVPPEPWEWNARMNTSILDMDQIKNVSFSLRSLLEDICPELVSTAESFAGDVLYLPNSALGRSPELNEETGMLGIRSQEVQPFWVTVPMMYFFCERGFIPVKPRSKREKRELVPIEYKVSGDVVFVRVPGREKPLQIPLSYMGARLQVPGTDLWFDLPVRRSSSRRK
ncbi:MAG: FHA domain-containing protein [Lentisphaeria bacterium]|nr:FHA domain-containing protein [Lentisphaeria bacterium]